MQPRHCLSASSRRREELAQARDTAGQWRSTRKARRSLPQPAAACAQATTCFWERTHVHPWFQSPKSAMAAASARPDQIGQLRGRRAAISPDWNRATPEPLAGRRKNQLSPKPIEQARRRGADAATRLKKSSGTASPGPAENQRIEARSYMRPPRRKKSRAAPPLARETTRNPRWIKAPRGLGGRRQLGWGGVGVGSSVGESAGVVK